MLLHSLHIGSLSLKTNVFVAPLAGYTDLPTRLIYRKQGAGIAYAEMVSAEGLNHNFQKSVRLIDTNREDSPLGIQLFGPNYERILPAFEKISQEEFDLVDLNCGCSVKKIIRNKAGAFLLNSPEEIYRILQGLKMLTSKPITLKIRSGWNHNSINYPEVYDAAYQAGAALITLHPRTKSMLFNGKSEWSHIKKLKSMSKIPVIGNGDIFTAEDAVSLMQQTGCDGIMLARGLLENPFLVEEVIAALSNTPYTQRSKKERLESCKEHCLSLIDYLKNETRGIMAFRKFFRGYVKGFQNASYLKQIVNTVTTFSEFEAAILQYEENTLSHIAQN